MPNPDGPLTELERNSNPRLGCPCGDCQAQIREGRRLWNENTGRWVAPGLDANGCKKDEPDQ